MAELLFYLASIAAAKARASARSVPSGVGQGLVIGRSMFSSRASPGFSLS